jgi:hypothetical protein
VRTQSRVGREKQKKMIIIKFNWLLHLMSRVSLFYVATTYDDFFACSLPLDFILFFVINESWEKTLKRERKPAQAHTICIIRMWVENFGQTHARACTETVSLQLRQTSLLFCVGLLRKLISCLNMWNLRMFHMLRIFRIHVILCNLSWGLR